GGHCDHSARRVCRRRAIEEGWSTWLRLQLENQVRGWRREGGCVGVLETSPGRRTTAGWRDWLGGSCCFQVPTTARAQNGTLPPSATPSDSESQWVGLAETWRYGGRQVGQSPVMGSCTCRG